MNSISDFICSFYSVRQACLVDEMNDDKIVRTALGGLELVALSYLWLQKCKKGIGDWCQDWGLVQDIAMLTMF